MAKDLAAIAKAKKIEYFIVSFVDMLGQLRAKLVPARAINGMQKDGAGFAGFAAWLDMTPAHPDMFGVPDPDDEPGEDPDDWRLRLSSIEATEVSERLLELIASHPRRIAPHLHMPLQSGDDGVLRAMFKDPLAGKAGRPGLYTESASFADYFMTRRER